MSSEVWEPDIHEQDESGTAPVLLMRSSNASDSGSDDDSVPPLHHDDDSSDESSASSDSEDEFSYICNLFCVMIPMQLALHHVHVTLCSTDDC